MNAAPGRRSLRMNRGQAYDIPSYAIVAYFAGRGPVPMTLPSLVRRLLKWLEARLVGRRP